MPVYRRAGMGEGFEVEGPAIVEFAEATCVVRPGWSGAIDAAGTLVLERASEPRSRHALACSPARCRGIAEEAGAVLIRGAYSSNIKERRDCSAALFDAEGAMVAQAEHIPVHLGAMPEAVAAVIEHEPDPGDVWIVNDPYRGGTHLPDITLVSPLDVDGDILAYAVTRAHHSDVGGMRPGSMPADSRDVYQEGIVIPPLRLGDDVLELILANVRTPDIRRGDLRAQTAANQLAGRRLEELVERRGRDDGRAGVRGGRRLRGAAHARGAARRARRHLRGRARDGGRRRHRRRRADRARR